MHLSYYFEFNCRRKWENGSLTRQFWSLKHSCGTPVYILLTFGLIIESFSRHWKFYLFFIEQIVFLDMILFDFETIFLCHSSFRTKWADRVSLFFVLLLVSSFYKIPVQIVVRAAFCMKICFFLLTWLLSTHYIGNDSITRANQWRVTISVSSCLRKY